MWGHWDGAHWLYDAPMFYKDWTLKPSGQAYADLVFKKWWTNAQGTTGAQGGYKVRGFQGDYEVTVSHNGKTKTIKATLPSEGRTLNVTW